MLQTSNLHADALALRQAGSVASSSGFELAANSVQQGNRLADDHKPAREGGRWAEAISISAQVAEQVKSMAPGGCVSVIRNLAARLQATSSSLAEVAATGRAVRQVCGWLMVQPGMEPIAHKLKQAWSYASESGSFVYGIKPDSCAGSGSKRSPSTTSRNRSKPQKTYNQLRSLKASSLSCRSRSVVLKCSDQCVA